MIAASSHEVDAQLAAETFVRRFGEQYGAERGPRFVDCGWQEAAVRAHQQYKFLFVYIHSPNHQVRGGGPGRRQPGLGSRGVRGPASLCWASPSQGGVDAQRCAARGCHGALRGRLHCAVLLNDPPPACPLLSSSPSRQDTDSFCRSTLCNPDVADLINRLFVAWGGDVRYSDAYRVRSQY